MSERTDDICALCALIAREEDLTEWEGKALPSMLRAGGAMMLAAPTEKAALWTPKGREIGSLIAAYQEGDLVAGEVLLKAHARAIEHWAVRTAAWSRLDLDDCRQEAALGLLHAAKIYDPSRGASFITMALPWIRQHVERWAQDNARLIRLPVHQQVAIGKELRGGEQFVRIKGKRYKVTPREEARRNFGIRLPSLDAPVGDEDGLTLGELLADKNLTPEEALERAEAHAKRCLMVERAMRRLTPREREIVVRHSLNEDRESLRDIGHNLGITRQGANFHYTRALNKIRAELRLLGATSVIAELWSDA